MAVAADLQTLVHIAAFSTLGGAVNLMKTRISFLTYCELVSPIIDATRRVERHGLA